MKKIILVDFDRTLINSNVLRAMRLSIAKEFGAPALKAERVYIAMSRQALIPRRYFDRLIRDKKKRVEAIRRAEALHNTPKEYNFPGVEGFLARLRKKYVLILFTHGHPKVQAVKLKQSGLKHFFNDVVMVKNRDKKSDLAFFLKKYGANVLLLDDSDEAIRSAREIGMRSVAVKKTWKDRMYYQKLLKRIEAVH